MFNPIGTGVIGEHVSLGGVLFTSWVYSFVCKPGTLKFDTQLKITIKSNIELDMTNCDVS